MINIEIHNDIKIKHAKYIYTSNIKGNIETMLNKREISANIFGDSFASQHIYLCNYIINEINELEYAESKIDTMDKNLFLAKPDVLDNIKNKICKKCPEISKAFDNKTEEKYKEYSKEMLKSIGYKDFSSANMVSFYKKELDFLVHYTKGRLNKLYEEMMSGIGENDLNRIFLERVSDEIRTVLEANKNYDILSLLKELMDKLKCVNIDEEKKKFIDSIHSIIMQSYKVLRKISESQTISLFNYKVYSREGGFNWSAYDFVMDLNLKVCPYCNRNYIAPIYSEHSGRLRADLDHFYGKSKFPYLSMSIYNLVPSCKFCNSSLKGEQEFSYTDYLNPYEDIPDQLSKFTYIPKSVDSFYGLDEIDICINYVNRGNDDQLINKIKNNYRVFNILNLYQYHRDIVTELIKKRLIYDETYIAYILTEYSNIFKTRKEVIEFILGSIQDDNIKDVPFGKLIKDILVELAFDIY